ncbi:MAG: hypothetical protein PVG14_02725 [Anaerolineales bacterium]
MNPDHRKLTKFIHTLVFGLFGLLTACSPLFGISSPEVNVPQEVAPNKNKTPSKDEENRSATIEAEILAQRSPEVPKLPFPDNPDPDQCGIPIEWGEDGKAWLNGYYESDLIQPIVFLYDSHLRLNIKAKAPHGSEVRVILYQSNPVLDYYMVQVVGEQGPDSQGWVPAPLLSFEPIEN